MTFIGKSSYASSGYTYSLSVKHQHFMNYLSASESSNTGSVAWQIIILE